MKLILSKLNDAWSRGVLIRELLNNNSFPIDIEENSKNIGSQTLLSKQNKIPIQIHETVSLVSKEDVYSFLRESDLSLD